MILYGISNCDTVRKAKKYLESAGYSFVFHDFRKDGLRPAMLESWLKFTDYAQLINKRSTGWKGLTAEQQQAVDQHDLVLVCQFPTLIKRPVLVTETKLLIGFNINEYKAL